MRTSQRHLQPQLRVENESRRRGVSGFSLVALQVFSPARVPSPSAKEEEGVSLSAAQPGTHKGSLWSHFKRTTMRGGKKRDSLKTDTFISCLRRQNRHWSLLFNRVQKRCGAALGRTTCATLRVLVCGSCNYQLNLIHLYCTYFMSEIKLAAHSLVFLEK